MSRVSWITSSSDNKSLLTLPIDQISDFNITVPNNISWKFKLSKQLSLGLDYWLMCVAYCIM